MFEWKEEPFIFLRNLPKIACSNEVIECSRALYIACKPKIEVQKIRNLYFGFGMQLWMTVIALHFIYHCLTLIFPKLKQF